MPPKPMPTKGYKAPVGTTNPVKKERGGILHGQMLKSKSKAKSKDEIKLLVKGMRKLAKPQNSGY